jgi:uncharacterized protein (DUF1330 family)
MQAYAIGTVQMRDPSWVEEYLAKLQPLLEKHGGRCLVRAWKMEKLEGAAPLPDVLVVLEFPTMEHARAWYQDPEYVPLVKLRQGGSDVELILAEGIALGPTS